ncbi:MAG: hypothetical protein PQJ46_17240 [Spirochaetales bacterium]|nr:hypothetical protein [Spirochaetales bacterium]
MDQIERLDELIKKGNLVLSTHTPNPPNFIGFPTLNAGKFGAWKTQTIAFLESILPSENIYLYTFRNEITQGFKGTVSTGIEILESLKEDIENGFLQTENAENLSNPYDNVVLIFEKFHTVARQLRERYSDRNTLEIEDEYDVQDLFHSLLRLYFDDIRPEEWTPSYAGQSARMDFLLKNENIVIEIKKTRKNLKAKEVGNQLIEDIERYKNHSGCDILLCFVYDPEGLIGNPKGLENDLNRDTNEIHVRVFIRP